MPYLAFGHSLQDEHTQPHIFLGQVKCYPLHWQEGSAIQRYYFQPSAGRSGCKNNHPVASGLSHCNGAVVSCVCVCVPVKPTRGNTT